jgi:hypothetical protein
MPNFGINQDSANPNNRRRTDREHNKDNRVMNDNITTTININRASDHEDINRGHRVPHDRNVGACASIKPY